MSSYIQEFKIYLKKEKQASVPTISAYISDIQGFFDFLTDFDSEPFTATKPDIEAYLSMLSNIGKSGSTVLRNVSSIRCYYDYLISSGSISSNPANDIKADKKNDSDIVYLSVDEIKKLLNQPDTSCMKGIRDRAILELSYATGIKSSELVGLNTDDVNIPLKALKCVKGDNIRIIPMYEKAFNVLENYLYNVRPFIASDDECALFVNLRNGRRITRQGIWKLIKGYNRQAGIDKEITPHTLRNSFALHLLENGMDTRQLQDIMGLSNISSLDIYIDILTEKLNSNYKKFHPGDDF